MILLFIILTKNFLFITSVNSILFFILHILPLWGYQCHILILCL